MDESLGVLEQEATPISGGVIILWGAAALESLMADLLDRSEDSSMRRAGLRRKAAELARRWAGRIDGDALKENVDWLAERRNAFAQNLIDSDGDWPGSLPGRFNGVCGIDPPEPVIVAAYPARNMMVIQRLDPVTALLTEFHTHLVGDRHAR